MAPHGTASSVLAAGNEYRVIFRFIPLFEQTSFASAYYTHSGAGAIVCDYLYYCRVLFLLFALTELPSEYLKSPDGTLADWGCL